MFYLKWLAFVVRVQILARLPSSLTLPCPYPFSDLEAHAYRPSGQVLLAGFSPWATRAGGGARGGREKSISLCPSRVSSSSCLPPLWTQLPAGTVSSSVSSLTDVHCSVMSPLFGFSLPPSPVNPIISINSLCCKSLAGFLFSCLDPDCTLSF